MVEDVDLDLSSLQIETEDKPSLSSIQSGRWCVAPLKYLMIRKRFRNSISQHQGYSERQWRSSEPKQHSVYWVTWLHGIREGKFFIFISLYRLYVCLWLIECLSHSWSHILVTCASLICMLVSYVRPNNFTLSLCSSLIYWGNFYLQVKAQLFLFVTPTFSIKK